jgi:transcriptional regulator with XRE-family HTH domain
MVLDKGSPGVQAAFGTVLRELRQAKGWSQETLSFESKSDRNYISLLELGRSAASISILFKFCEALEIAPSDFMRLVENRVEERRKLGGN